MISGAKLNKIITFAGLLVAFTYCHSQQRDSDIRLRLAQSYERSGNYETATKLYEELYAKDSTNYFMFDALRRMYLQLKRYDEAIEIIQRRIKRTPNDVVLLAELGTAYMRASNGQKAFDTWEKAIAADPKNETTFRIVCDAMIENRVFDHAIATFQRGRKALNDPKLFTPDLAYLYSIILNYTDATREFLNLLRDAPQQLGFVQARMATYTARADGLGATTLVIEQAVQTEPANVAFLQLLSWLYMEGKRYDSAYIVYRTLDEKTKASGREIYNFAERALKEKAYDVAAKAFLEVVTGFPKFPQVPEAKFGYARTLEEASAERDTSELFGKQSPFTPTEKPATESQPSFTGSVAAYKRIVAEYPNSEIAGRSLLRIGTVMYERFFNLNEARSALEQIDQQYTAYPAVLLEGRLLLGDVYLALGDLGKAEAVYTSLSTFRFVFQDYQQKGSFRLAELDYFRGKFQEALKQLNQLTKNASANITNDALSLQIFIQENLQPEAALKEYAKAELLERQQKLSEALTIFEDITKTYKDSPLIDETLMEMGDILAHLNRYSDAIASYERLTKDFPESIMQDRTLMKIGELYQLGLNDNPKAIESYGRLLEQYPNSIYVSEARKHIRELRGDTL